MSDTVLLALIVAVPQTVALLLATWRNGKKVDAVHTIVNDQRTRMMAEIEDLKNRVAALKADAR